MRTKAREVVFQIVFAAYFGGADNELKSSLSKKESLNDDDKKYVDEVLSLIKNHNSVLTEIIDKRSVAFPECRIYPADKSIILVALAEILFMPDVPKPVSVNEAANMASKYSSPKSASFVSGILSAVEKGSYV